MMSEFDQSKNFKVNFYHPVTKELLESKQFKSMNDIASSLGVSRHALYRYFNDKVSDNFKKSSIFSLTDINKIEDKKIEDSISCECGGKYKLSTKYAHSRTNRHKKFSQSNIIESEKNDQNNTC